MYLSVVIPAYNEAKRITLTLQSIFEYLKKQNYGYEVLVVNDGSKDGTAAVVSDFTKEFPQLKLIDNKQNRGKAKVVQQGMLAARGDLRLFMDADNATTIDNLDKMLPYINEGYGVVIASIGIKGAEKIGEEPFYRRLLGQLGNFWIRFWAVPGIYDTQRGFKLFTREITEKIFPKMLTFGWGFDVELLALARKYGYKIKEIPIIWKNAPGSKVNIWAYPKVLMQTLKIRWNLTTKKYDPVRSSPNGFSE